MLSKQQIKYLTKIGLNLDYNNLSDNDWIKIEDAVASRLEALGFDKNYNVTLEGKMCESILDVLP